MEITFLTPVDQTQNHVTKIYKKENGVIKQIANYNAGYLFNFVREKIPEAPTVKERLEYLADLFKKYGPTHFRIYGKPEAGLVAPTQRKKVNFPPDQAGYRLLHIDIDKWPIPDDIASISGFDLTPDTTADAIRLTLAHYGVDILSETDFLILLSASQFTTDTLSAHVYFFLEKPVTLREIRRLAIAFNQAKGGDKLLDHAVYKSVQPDFISAPVCDNFQDPVQQRVFVSSIGGPPMVTRKAWTDFRRGIEQAVGAPINSKSFSDNLGDTWQEILELHAGSKERGINQPCYLAAAKMVREVGTARVLASVSQYAVELYRKAWEEILAKGVRVGPEDQSKYDLNKFDSYVRSAATKGIGDEVDNLERDVTGAIENAIKNNDPAVLLNTHIVGSANKLKNKYPAAYARVYNAIATRAKFLVNPSAWTKAVDSCATTVRNTKEELMKLLPNQVATPSMAPTGHELIELGKGKVSELEHNLRKSILSQYDLIKPPSGEYLLGSNEVTTDGVTIYKLTPLDHRFANIIQSSVETNIKEGITESFGRRCLTHLQGKFDSGDHFVNTAVEYHKHVFFDEKNHALWMNMGRRENYKPECVMIDSSGVHRMYHDDPRCNGFYWMHRNNYVEVAGDETLNHLNGFDEIMEYFVSRLSYYINTTDKELQQIITWMVTAMTSEPLPYLLELTGPAGSGKSTASTLLKDLIDPTVPITSDSRFDARLKFDGADESFLHTLESNLVSIIDNTSYLSARKQDDLCRFVTGYSFERRILYTQIYQDVFIRRPLIVNGLSAAITKNDLLERTIKVELRRIDKYDPNFYKNWGLEVSVLRRCLFELVNKLMVLRANDSKLTGVSRRDLLIGRVRALLQDGIASSIRIVGGALITDNVQSVQHAREHTHESALQDALDDLGCVQFSLFLEDFQPVDGKYYRQSYLLSEYRKWARDNFGKQLAGKLSGIEVYHSVAQDEVPDTGRGFGWFMRRSRKWISALSNYEVSVSHRDAKGRKRKFFRKLSLTDIF